VAENFWLINPDHVPLDPRGVDALGTEFPPRHTLSRYWPPQALKKGPLEKTIRQNRSKIGLT